MNRKIKFRGRTPEGKWLYGDLLRVAGGTLIYYGSPVEAETCELEGVGVVLMNNEIAVVVPETVGQFTGLHDINGEEIYEGDVVKWHDKYPPKVISWFICQFDAGDTKSSMSLLSLKDKCPLEVIGNIHDNPELMKGGTQ